MITVENKETEQLRGIPGVVQLIGGKIRPLESLVGLPPRVANRGLLHQHGFVKMFTGIIAPGEVWGLNELRKLSKEARNSNLRIGIKPSEYSIVLRTRDVPESHVNGLVISKPRVGGTNSMLMVRGMDKLNSKMVSMTGSNNEEEVWEDLNSWRESRIRGNHYVLVHQEDAVSQRKSIHGRVCWLSDGACELSIGSGVLHAREIGSNGYPYVSMVGHEVTMMLEMIAEGRGRIPGSDRNRPSYLSDFRSNNWEQADKMSRDMLPWVEELKRLKTEMVPILRSNVVFEFRLYRGDSAEAGLNVYDFDYSLGRAGVTTLGGLKPEEAYLRELQEHRRFAA